VAELIFVLGGARSGKSAFARRLAADGPAPVVFIATMTPGDEESGRRIERHRRERPPDWRTVEEPIDVVEAIVRATAPDVPGTVLLDCLSLWVSNLTLRLLGESPSPDEADAAEEQVLRSVDSLLAQQRGAAARLVIVSNEVGAGVVPPYPLGRAFRDILGLAHQRVAAQADRVYFVVAGIPNEIKGPGGS
jgi:adenosylcobinamide kinase/adenosylcobinamide-phosphate guanylyltransferase